MQMTDLPKKNEGEISILHKSCFIPMYPISEKDSILFGWAHLNMTNSFHKD